MPDQAIGYDPQRPSNYGRKKKMQMDELRAMLAAEYESAMGALQASKLVTERADALDYYFGHMQKDMPAQDGRSQSVSFDVADTIEGLMPSLMEIFAGSDDVVMFNPQNQNDVEQAKQETEYVNHVFMNENDGFLVLYSFIKDALLSKVGIVKVFWEERAQYESEHYYGLDDVAYSLVTEDPDVEVVEHSEYPADESDTEQKYPSLPPAGGAGGISQGAGPSGGNPLPMASQGSPPQLPPGNQGMYPGAAPPGQGPSPMPLPPGVTPPNQPGPSQPVAPGQTLHDVKVVRKRDYSQATVVPVPPEEFVIERGARYTVRKSNYCCHKVIKSETELVEMGFDEQQVRDLPVYRAYTNPEEIARDSVDEHQFYGDDVNRSARLKQVLEHYVRMDYEGDGRARLYKVTTSGITGEVLNLSDGGGSNGRGDILRIKGKPDIEEVDEMPFACMTPIPNTHRFWGRSIADVTMDIQRIKTALQRGMLDGLYLALNPRAIVAENGASDTTIDDLLVSRPLGVIRVQQAGAVTFQEVPNVSEKIIPNLQYFDQLREWRTGVNRMQQGLDADSLLPKTATEHAQQSSAAQQRMKLIARIFAETGIRDMFYLLHGCIRKHSERSRTVRLRGQWVTVDPRNWKNRNDMTISVGMGSGGKAQRLAEIGLIGQSQEKFLQAGLVNLVTPDNLYNGAKELVRAVGHKDVDQFFTDPKGQPPPPPKQDPKLQIEQMKMQGQMQLQQAKQQQEGMHEKAKLEADSALAQQKFQLEKELALLEFQLKQREMEQNLQHRAAEHQMDLTKMHHEMQLGMRRAQNDAHVDAMQHGQELQQNQQLHDQAMQQSQAEADQAKQLHSQKLEAGEAAAEQNAAKHEQQMKLAKTKPVKTPK